MARVKCKGTVIEHDIASTLTAIAQVVSIDIGESKTETFDADTLDNANAGMPKDPTGRAEGGDIGLDLFLDPALSGHQLLTDDITTPAKRDYNLTFADTGATDWPFTVAGIGVGVTVDMADGLKASVTLEVDGIPTFAT